MAEDQPVGILSSGASYHRPATRRLVQVLRPHLSRSIAEIVVPIVLAPEHREVLVAAMNEQTPNGRGTGS